MTNKINVFIWRAIFAIAYAATVLPFTLTFFKSIASPSVRETLLLMPLMVDAHNFMLPVFLASLEFASIQIAITLWMKKQLTPTYLILILFLACQAYPVVSLYYDIRLKDYQDVMRVDEKSRNENIESQKNRIAGLGDQIAKTSNELARIRGNRDSNNVAIDKLLFRTNQQKYSANIDSTRVEIQNRQTFREKREHEIDDHLKQKKELEDELNKKGSELEGFIRDEHKGLKYKSEIEFIAKEFFTYRSAFAGFLALLFPVSILGAAYIMPKNGENDTMERPSFDLKHHLEIASQLSANHHPVYIQGIIPSLRMHLSAMNACKKLANENTSLNLKDNLIFENIDEVKLLQEEILKSKIDENSKNYLVKELEKTLDREINLN